jgi:hypothetical protein
MNQRSRIGILVCAIAFLIAGCSSSRSNTAEAAGTPGAGSGAPSGQKAGAATYTGTPLSTQFTTATITDPSLNNMVAATLTIPAGWKLQGISEMLPCISTGPAPIYRAFSPDGLMQMRGEPLMGWKWSPSFKPDQNGCVNIEKPISAADFLTYYTGTMQGGVHVVGPMPVPASSSTWGEKFAAMQNQNNARLPPFMQADNTADSAALRVEVVNGSFVEEERLLVTVVCSVHKQATYGGQCFARMNVLIAPEGRLDALVHLVDSNNLPNGVAPPDYKQAVMQRLYQQNQRAADKRTEIAYAKDAAFSKMMYSAFQQNMARSASEHQQFMQQQESSFESSMNNANASMNARSTAASDWVDYSLDQQTVMNPNGTITKLSSAYSQTWTNGTQWYQTNDPNANPNGVLRGNWTPTTQVHGNGQPR